jgi:hypothetical protein
MKSPAWSAMLFDGDLCSPELCLDVSVVHPA